MAGTTSAYLSLAGRLGAALVAVIYWALIGSYMLSVWRHRSRNFILELRLPWVQIVEAGVNGVMVSLLLGQHAYYGLLGPVTDCRATRAVSNIMSHVVPALILLRNVRGIIVLDRARRKRFRAFTGRKAMMASVLGTFIVAFAWNAALEHLPLCVQVCRPNLCMASGSYWVFVAQFLFILIFARLSHLIKEMSSEDPLSAASELQQVATIYVVAMAAYLPILLVVDLDVVTSPLYRLAGHFVILSTAMDLFVIVCLSPAIRHGYGPELVDWGLFQWCCSAGKDKANKNIKRVAPEEDDVLVAVPNMSAKRRISRREAQLHDELFQVVDLEETRVMCVEYCRTAMCEDHALFVIEYRRFAQESHLRTRRQEFRSQLLDIVDRYMREGGDQDLELDLRLGYMVAKRARRFGLRRYIFDDEAREMQNIVEGVYLEVLRKLTGRILRSFKASAPYQAYLSGQALKGRLATRDDFVSYFSVAQPDEDDRVSCVEEEAGEDGGGGGGTKRSSTSTATTKRSSSSKHRDSDGIEECSTAFEDEEGGEEGDTPGEERGSTVSSWISSIVTTSSKALRKGKSGSRGGSGRSNSVPSSESPHEEEEERDNQDSSRSPSSSRHQQSLSDSTRNRNLQHLPGGISSEAAVGILLAASPSPTSQQQQQLQQPGDPPLVELTGRDGGAIDSIATIISVEQGQLQPVVQQQQQQQQQKSASPSKKKQQDWGSNSSHSSSVNPGGGGGVFSPTGSSRTRSRESGE